MLAWLLLRAGNGAPARSAELLRARFRRLQPRRPSEDVKGLGILLDVARSSLNYDLNRKSPIDAFFDLKEVWVIDARRRIAHRLADNRAEIFNDVKQRDLVHRLTSAGALEAFAFTLDDRD